jgi:hypothetical protein
MSDQIPRFFPEILDWRRRLPEPKLITLIPPDGLCVHLYIPVVTCNSSGTRPKPAQSAATRHRFADAATSFDDDRALTIPDPDIVHEERFLTLAMDASGRVLVTAWTGREDSIRLISARKASARERHRYSSRRKGD